MNESYKNILIVRTDRIGDLILTLPLAGLIKKNFPNSRISFLIRNYTRQIINDHPFVDEVITLDEHNGKIRFLGNLKKIKSKKFDACVVVYPKFIIALILFLSGIKLRIGTGYRWYSFLFNKKVFEHRKYASRHELEFNVKLLESIGIKTEINDSNVNYDLRVDQKAKEIIEGIFKQEKISTDKPVVIIHPGSAGSSVDLPVEKYKILTESLSAENYQIILTGSKEEIDICNQLKANEKIVNLAGKFSLSELIALISKCDLFVANSTGPIHIAAALGKWTVGFYPKILSCSKERWAPYTDKKLIFEPEIDCKNCNREQCEELDCMNSIDINKVLSGIKNVLDNIMLEKK